MYPSNNSEVKFEYKALAPNFKLINSLKKKLISEESFLKSYMEQLSELNPKTVFEHLNLVTGDFEPVMMCHCGKTKFCHRHIAAQWLQDNLGVRIIEHEVPYFERKNGYLIKKKAPSLFNDKD